MSKFVFVTGGVVSGLGKGLASASIGLLLKKRGLKVSVLKLDPYLNVNPGKMSPLQHGEVFITEDGGETDLDLGHYERFIDINLSKISSCSSGQIYRELMEDEDKGKFTEGTIQVVPHITNKIKERIRKVAEKSNADVVMVEIGGTVGDMEGEPFLEAIRQFRNEVGKKNSVFVHLTLIPFLKTSKELKTKPTQHSVKELQRHGIQPDILICRTEVPLPYKLREKLSLFCDVPVDAIFQGIDVESLYDVPLNFYAEGIDDKICDILEISLPKANIEDWIKLAETYKKTDPVVNVFLIGDYVELPDAYLSTIEALNHAGSLNEVKVNIKLIHPDELKDSLEVLKEADGVIMHGNSEINDIETKIKICQYVRENNIPYLGIGLGMQVAVIDFALNVVNMKILTKDKIELTCFNMLFDKVSNSKTSINRIDGKRIGAYECSLDENSLSYKIYQENTISERHRHKYEFNNKYKNLLEKKGLIFAGTVPSNGLVEVIENKEHKWFIGVQFYPEFKSRVDKPHPLFKNFIEVCIKKDPT